MRSTRSWGKPMKCSSAILDLSISLVKGVGSVIRIINLSCRNPLLNRSRTGEFDRRAHRLCRWICAAHGMIFLILIYWYFNILFSFFRMSKFSKFVPLNNQIKLNFEDQIVQPFFYWRDIHNGCIFRTFPITQWLLVVLPQIKTELTQLSIQRIFANPPNWNCLIGNLLKL